MTQLGAAPAELLLYDKSRVFLLHYRQHSLRYSITPCLILDYVPVSLPSASPTRTVRTVETFGAKWHVLLGRDGLVLYLKVWQ